MFGRRSDGKEVKKLTPILRVLPCIMKERNDAFVLSSFDINLKGMEEYIAAKKKENIHITILDIVFAAVVRVIAERPLLNRFVVNQRVYQRNNIKIALMVKETLTDDGPESEIQPIFDGNENIFEVRDKIQQMIAECKNPSVSNDTDRFGELLSKVPIFVVQRAIGLCRFLDKHGMLPKKIIKLSPCHASAFITHMGSLGLESIYHNCWNYGTITTFLSIGKKFKKENGNKYMTFKFVNDERICEGFYFAKTFHIFKKYLMHPELLEKKIEVVYK